MTTAIFIFDVGEVAHRLRRTAWPLLTGTEFGDPYSLELLIEEWFRHFFYKSSLVLVDKSRLDCYPSRAVQALHQEYLELESYLHRFFCLPTEFRVKQAEMRLDDDSLYLRYVLGDSR